MTALVDLSQLRAMGLVASNPLVRKEINIRYRPMKPESEWQEPGQPERQDEFEEASVTVFIRKFTAADQIAISNAKTNEEVAYISIQRTVFTEDGQHLFPTMDDAYGLDLDMFAPLLGEIRDINEIGKAKKSQPRTKRGVTSRSPSADAVLRSGNKSSPQTSSTSGSSSEAPTAP